MGVCLGGVREEGRSWSKAPRGRGGEIIWASGRENVGRTWLRPPSTAPQIMPDRGQRGQPSRLLRPISRKCSECTTHQLPWRHLACALAFCVTPT